MVLEIIKLKGTNTPQLFTERGLIIKTWYLWNYELVSFCKARKVLQYVTVLYAHQGV
jgi:hypothetical protein